VWPGANTSSARRWSECCGRRQVRDLPHCGRRLLKREVYSDLGKDIHGLAIQKGRRILPLLECIQGGLDEIRWRIGA
jgi:hypothetical protein